MLITAGSTHATGMLARLLLDPGERAWTENPGWPTGRQTLAAHQVVPVPVPVDGDGLDVDAGWLLAPDARLALVTPTRQYPLGMGMPLARRSQLLAWAHDQMAWILEDDYDGEFQYAARVLPPLQTLDRHGRVIYMGSFSKVLTQALRIGYLVVPPALQEPVARASPTTRWSRRWRRRLSRTSLSWASSPATSGACGRCTGPAGTPWRRRSATSSAAPCPSGRENRASTRSPPCRPAATGGWCRAVAPGSTCWRRRWRTTTTRERGGRPVRLAVPPALLLGFATVDDDELRRGIAGLARALE